jgi:hypothetical protein
MRPSPAPPEMDPGHLGRGFSFVASQRNQTWPRFACASSSHHREARRCLCLSIFFGIGGTGNIARGLCIRKNRKDANEDFTTGGSLPRAGSGVFESCRHRADAADARSIPRHGPPLSYSGSDAWEEGASQPPKRAFEGAEVQVWKEALHSRLASVWSNCAALTDVTSMRRTIRPRVRDCLARQGEWRTYD